MSALAERSAVALVARREVTERVRERSFLISTAVTATIVVLVSVLPTLLGAGGPTTYDLAVSDPAALPVARAAASDAGAFKLRLHLQRLSPSRAQGALDGGGVDAVLSRRGLASREQADAQLVALLQTADRDVSRAQALRAAGLHGGVLQRAMDPPPLRVVSAKAPDPERDRKGRFAFVAVLVLYGQLLTFGFLLASGVVEEKSSRVVEVLLATIRPRTLLAGKVIGLGLIGLGQLLVITAIGLTAGTAAGSITLNGEILAAAGLAVAWFVLGYAFYAGAFACAGALVPRQEELQSSIAPLTLMILVSFFLAFAVLDDPSGTLAHVTSFIPMTAPMTMPPRIALGEASPLEIVGAFVVTALAAAALIPLAGRIYSNAILRTGTAIRLREAWRLR